MIATIVKIGDSGGIIFDTALLELAHLRPGDEVNLEIDEAGAITITPLRLHVHPTDEQASAIVRNTMSKYPRTMKKLA